MRHPISFISCFFHSGSIYLEYSHHSCFNFYIRLGGPDPLDYISMYANPGIPHENIPPHWHYIRFKQFLEIILVFITI